MLMPRASATHIVGGELFYEKLSGNNYRITLKLYRDCINGVAPYDNPAYIGIYNTSGTLIQVLNVTFPGSTVLQQNPSSTCGIVINNVCVEEAVYTTIVNLPPIVGGYDIVYQRCCRNNTIINLDSPGNAGSTYYAHIPGSNIVTTNSSPFYNNFPPIYLCANTPISFDHSATDLDGDSLVYELCNPFDGASSTTPQPTTPDPPPYNNVVYNPGFTSGYPLTSNPALSIDPNTGLLTGVPTQLGQFVVGVCVSEYRNGVLLSVNKRDFQFNVLQCANPIATIPFANVQVNNNGDPVLCNGYTVFFDNSSVNANSYSWNFGDPTTTSDVSTQASPSYTYPDSGSYQVTLVAYNSNSQCYDTAEVTIHVYPDLIPEIQIISDSIQCFTGNSFDFSAGGSYTQDVTFNWQFEQANIDSSNLMTLNSVVFDTSGTFTVFLNAQQYGCVSRDSITIRVIPEPVIDILPPASSCNGLTISPLVGSNNVTDYLWNFGDPSTLSDTSILQNPTYTYSSVGTYTLTLSVSNQGICFASDQENFQIFNELNIDLQSVTPQCFNGNQFNFQVSGNYSGIGTTYFWQYENANINNSNLQQPGNISFLIPGDHKVKITISENGCSKSDSIIVNVLPNPSITINPQSAYCEGVTVSPTCMAQNVTSYFWDFGVIPVSTDTSSLPSPVYTYSDTGNYTISLTVSNQGYCSASDQINFQVNPRIIPFIEPFSSQCFSGNSFDFFAGGTFDNNTAISWDLNPAASITTANAQNVFFVNYPSAGAYPISVTYTAYGCVKSYLDTVIIYNSPVASFNTTNQSGCPPYTASFSNTSVSDVPVVYLWNFGDGTTSQDENPNHLYANTGVYNVSLTVMSTQGCIDTSYASAPGMITVHGLPTPGFNIDTTSYTGNLPMYGFNNISPDAVYCSYNLGDGTVTESCDFVHTYSMVGLYTVEQTVTNEFGCKDSIIKYVYPAYYCYIPNAFTPDKDGLNDFFIPVIYGGKEITFTIFNRWGEVIFKTNQLNEGWNGTYQNKLCQQDVYTYTLEVKDVMKERHRYIGHVTLLK